MLFMKEPSQFSMGQTAQSLTCSIMEKQHTGLDDCLNMLLSCFRKTWLSCPVSRPPCTSRSEPNSRRRGRSRCHHEISSTCYIGGKILPFRVTANIINPAQGKLCDSIDLCDSYLCCHLGKWECWDNS